MKDCLANVTAGEGALTPGELKLLIELDLVRPTRVSADGRIQEYEYTHAARVLARKEVERWS